MTKEILKSLTNKNFYNEHKLKLNEDLFPGEQKNIYRIIEDFHNNYDNNLTFTEILQLWKVKNPVATQSEYIDFSKALDIIKNADDINDDVSNLLITNLWKSLWARKGAEILLRISEGDPKAELELDSHLAKRASGFQQDDFADSYVTDDVEELLKQVSDENRYRFNIKSLSRIVYGIGKKEFGCIFATPETGKTAFIASLCTAPNGFVDQGAKVLVLVNEEDGGRTKLRALQAITKLRKDDFTLENLSQNIKTLRECYRSIKDQFIVRNVGGYDFQKIEGLIENVNPDIVCIDQADKVHLRGTFNASHEKLRSLYTSFRELAKRQDIALIVVSQASDSAKNKTKLTPFDMENSKIGKAAEVDLLIGISKHPEQQNEEPDYTRFLSVCKNKLSGMHSTAVCLLNHQISRYED